MIRASLAPVSDLAAVGAMWRALESRADSSFFQSWTWLGCLDRERFDRPVLLRAERDGELVGLALLNRRGRTAFLAETGSPAWDALFVEHNGVLAARGERSAVLRACLAALARTPTVFSGVDDLTLAALEALSGGVTLAETRIAPRLDFAALGAGEYLDSISPNTRYQIRRSDRSYAARGTLRAERARSAAEAHDHLAALASLHQRYWTTKGRAGAFANPAILRFHHTLIERGFAAGEIDLLRISAGDGTIGYLYNFIHRREVLAYQSGFDYAAAGRHEKPGLTSHRLAIALYRAEGMAGYDFLAGADRYKTSLANAETRLHWVAYAPRFGAAWLRAGARRLLRAAAAPLIEHCRARTAP